MGRHVIQIPSADGRVYVYDTDKKTFWKVCGIEKAEDLPPDVKETLRNINLHIETGKA
jgi:hypothetical protein